MAYTEKGGFGRGRYAAWDVEDAAMLTMRAVVKRFGARTAVDGLSLAVQRGEVFGLLGPNGAGKSTTINMATGLLAPDSGEVRIDGGDPSDPDVRERLGVAPQALSLYEELTAKENLEFFGKLYGLHGAGLRRVVGELLERVGLSERANSKVGAFSGGMKRRLNLAVAMAHDPPLLMLDEPTVGVDPQSRNAILSLIEQLKREGRTIVYTTHYMEEAQRLCDRIAVVDHGKLLALDTVDGLIAAHGGRSMVRLETDTGEREILADDPVAELATALGQGNVRSVRVDRPNLESVFLALTGRTLRD